MRHFFNVMDGNCCAYDCCKLEIPITRNDEKCAGYRYFANAIGLISLSVYLLQAATHCYRTVVTADIVLCTDMCYLPLVFVK